MSWLGWGKVRAAPLADAFSEAYGKMSSIPGLLSDDPYYNESFTAYVVHLAKTSYIDTLEREAGLSEPSLTREALYPSILAGYTEHLYDIDSALLRPTKEGRQGWVVLTGRPGYGSSTIGQYIAYLWYVGSQLHYGNRSVCIAAQLSSVAQTTAISLWNRYALVLRVQCRLLGRPDIWENVDEGTPLGYLLELICQSSGISAHIDRSNLSRYLLEFSDSVLFILEGFDEVQHIYGVMPEATAVIDRVMSFDNGVITAKCHSIPDMWLSPDCRRVTECYELIGFDAEDARRYIKSHFVDSRNPGVSDLIITELGKNHNMSKFALVPVNCVALCVTWDIDSTGMMTSATDGLGGSALMLHRLITWLILRYGLMFKVTSAERRTRVAITAAIAGDICRRCSQELLAMAAVAFHAFKNDEQLSQNTISVELLNRFFTQKGMLRRIVATMGMIKAGPMIPASSCKLSDSYDYSSTFRFIHQDIYCYFVSLYVMEILCSGSDLILDVKLMDDVRAILTNKGRRYRQVKILAAGMTTLPDYIRGADTFWKIIYGESISNTSSESSLGVHITHWHLQSEAGSKNGLVSAALDTYYWMKRSCHSKDTYYLTPLMESIFCSCCRFSLLSRLGNSAALLEHWDYENNPPATIRKQLEYKRCQIFLAEKSVSLGLPNYHRIDANKWLMMLPSFSSGVERCVHELNTSTIVETRIAAANALGRVNIRDHNAVNALRKSLSADNVQLTLTAAQVLLHINQGDGESLAVLSAALHDTDDHVRQQAAFILGTIRSLDDECLSALRNALNNNSWGVCCAAAEALGRANSADANVIAILESALHDEDSGVRLAAIGVIGRIGARDDLLLNIVRESLNHDDWHIAIAAAETLALLGCEDKHSLSIIHFCIGTEDPYRRTVACETLGKCKLADDKSILLLRNALHDPEWAVRYAAAESLCRVAKNFLNKAERTSIVDVFRDAIQSPEWALRYTASEALGRCGGDNLAALSMLEIALCDDVKHVRVSAADALGQFVCGGNIFADRLSERLRILLKDDYWDVRRAAADALGRIEACDRNTLDALLETLWDSDIHVCRSAARAICHVSRSINDISVIKDLYDFLDSALVQADLDIGHRIHVALLRIMPINHLNFFMNRPERLVRHVCKRLFLYSLWLHAECLTANLQANPMTVHLNGVSTDVTCSYDDFSTFINCLTAMERDIVDELPPLSQEVVTDKDIRPAAASNGVILKSPSCKGDDASCSK